MREHERARTRIRLRAGNTATCIAVPRRALFGFGGVQQYAGLPHNTLVFAYTAHAARALSFCGCYTSTRELFKNIYVLQKVEFRSFFF